MAGERRAFGGFELMEPVPAPALAPEPLTERKTRGRPQGSKNKPKPPVVVIRQSESAMRPVVLELAAGCDVVSAVAAFARRRNVGVSVLCGRGAVAAVTLRLAGATTAASVVTLHGRFDVLALSGTVLPPSSLSAPPAVPVFSVSLAGVGGHVIGGTLGEMTAADGVVVVAAMFRYAEVHRLPAAGTEDGDADTDARGGGREEERHIQQQLQVAANGADVAGLGGYGGGGHVGQHEEQLAEMGLWFQQPIPTRRF